jgi:5'-nucleotidase
MIILVDMDGVLANFEEKFLEIYRSLYPNLPYIPVNLRRRFHIREEYPKELEDKVVSVWTKPGFYLSLDPIDKGLESINEIKNKGHDVFICTSPLSTYENCVLEKYKWVEKYLGNNWVRNIIFTKDKTIVHGNLLIDDNPLIKGIKNPSFEHIIYDCSYNKLENFKRRMTWNNWKDVLTEL